MNDLENSNDAAQPEAERASVASPCSAAVATWPAMRDEYVLSQFFAMCAESGNPEFWENVDAVIEHRCNVRSGLSRDSVNRCKAAAFEYLDTLKSCG